MIDFRPDNTHVVVVSSPKEFVRLSWCAALRKIKFYRIIGLVSGLKDAGPCVWFGNLDGHVKWSQMTKSTYQSCINGSLRRYAQSHHKNNFTMSYCSVSAYL